MCVCELVASCQKLLRILLGHAEQDFSLAAHVSLAEWSKALISGASPQGRGFEPHSCHSCQGLARKAEKQFVSCEIRGGRPVAGTLLQPSVPARESYGDEAFAGEGGR